jgi:hypothetical protein
LPRGRCVGVPVLRRRCAASGKSAADAERLAKRERVVCWATPDAVMPVSPAAAPALPVCTAPAPLWRGVEGEAGVPPVTGFIVKCQ